MLKLQTLRTHLSLAQALRVSLADSKLTSARSSSSIDLEIVCQLINFGSYDESPQKEEILNCYPECRNGGTCVHGKCVCVQGFFGHACQHGGCTPECQNGGLCLYGFCKCNPPYYGTACQEINSGRNENGTEEIFDNQLDDSSPQQVENKSQFRSEKIPSIFVEDNRGLSPIPRIQSATIGDCTSELGITENFPPEQTLPG
uniref:EGF-like domain-containing protein n=1 Tax=Romanomermis culicivorax TaxID=13658 RepID=A0A915JHM3_ROMCU